MKKTLIATVLTAGLFATSSYASPLFLDAESITGADLPFIFDGHTSKIAYFKSKGTFFTVEVHAGTAGERIEGRVIEQCDADVCMPVRGWVYDTNRSYGLKTDGAHYSTGAKLAQQTITGILDGMKKLDLSVEGNKKIHDSYVQALKQTEPYVTLKANTPAVLIINYDMDTPYGFCKGIKAFSEIAPSVVEDYHAIKTGVEVDCKDLSITELKEVFRSEEGGLLIGVKASVPTLYKKLIPVLKEKRASTAEEIKKEMVQIVDAHTASTPPSTDAQSETVEK